MFETKTSKNGSDRRKILKEAIAVLEAVSAQDVAQARDTVMRVSGKLSKAMAIDRLSIGIERLKAMAGPE